MKHLNQYINIRKKPSTIKAENANIRKIINGELVTLGYDADLNHIDTSSVTDMAYLFENTYFSGDVSMWDVSNVTRFTYMFYKCKDFNCDLGKWDTGNLVAASTMFCKCTNFEGIGLENWEIDKIEVAEHMFDECVNFNADISSWDMRNCWTIGYMFYDCKKFMQDLSGWEFKKMKHPHHIECKSVFTHSKMTGHKELWPKELL